MGGLLEKMQSFMSDRVFLPYGDKPIIHFLFQAGFLFTVPKKEFSDLKKIRQIVKVKPYTLLSYSRLAKLYELALLIEKTSVQGDFVECGVCNGGSAGLVANIFKNNAARDIWLFDSWKGMPDPGPKDAFADGGQNKKGIALGYLSKVENLFFSVLGCPRDRVHLVKGWFQDTLPLTISSLKNISLLHIDCDWYESVKFCLERLFDKVVNGGYVVIDDYGYWKGCRKAVDEFFAERKLTNKIIPIDYAGVYFQK